MDNLLKEYQQSLKSLRKEKEKAIDYDQKIYAAMIKDMQYAIYFLENGYPPGYQKGIHRKSQGLYFDSEFAMYVPKERYGDAYDQACDRIDAERELEGSR